MMDWGLLGIILAVVFFVAMIVLALKLVKKRQPVWAYETTKIIGLGSNAPPELKLTFNEQPVSDVYQTRVILFNKGNEPILNDNVTESVIIQFKGAEILRQPDIKAKSKEAIKFSAKQVVKGGHNSIEVNFLYLDHDDGAVVDVLHTASEEVTCTANIIGTQQIKNIGNFEPRPLQHRRRRLIALLLYLIILVVGPAGLSIYYLLTGYSREQPMTLVVFIVFWLSCTALWIFDFRRLFHYRKFPRWSSIGD
jgi:hypothetical protein